MSKNHSELKDLESTLAHQMLSSSYDRKSTHPERFLIDHLVEQVQAWGVGEVSIEELRATFLEHDIGNFDIDQWIATKVEEGVYSLEDTEPT